MAQLRGITDQVEDQLRRARAPSASCSRTRRSTTDANALVAKLDETSARLERIVAKIERGEGTVGKLINDEKLYADARDTIERLNLIMARLEKGEGTMGMILKDERLYNNVNNLSAEVTKLLYDFRQNPKKYLSVKVTIF